MKKKRVTFGELISYFSFQEMHQITPVKTLPSQTLFAGGNKTRLVVLLAKMIVLFQFLQQFITHWVVTNCVNGRKSQFRPPDWSWLLKLGVLHGGIGCSLGAVASPGVLAADYCCKRTTRNNET